MAGSLKTGRLPARICPECRESFLPKRIDSILCSPECRVAKQQREAREANAAKLKTIKCVVCKKPFKQKRSNQECCSQECNHKKQKNKESQARRDVLNDEKRICKIEHAKKNSHQTEATKSIALRHVLKRPESETTRKEIQN